MIRRAATALVLCLAAVARAGDGDDKTKTPAPAAPPAAETPKKDAPPVEPPLQIKGVRYRLELKAGGSIVGVVVGDHVFERRVGISWVVAEKDTPGAGIRLFFMNGLDGFAFVPMKEVKTAENLGEVTDDDRRELAAQRATSMKRAEEQREAQRGERAAREEAKAKAADDAKAAKAGTDDKTKTPAPAGSPTAAGAPTAEQLARYASLMAKYPPDKWSTDTPAKLEHRRLILGILPNDEEKAFLSVFDEWSKAYDVWKAAQPKPAADTPGK